MGKEYHILKLRVIVSALSFVYSDFGLQNSGTRSVN